LITGTGCPERLRSLDLGDIQNLIEHDSGQYDAALGRGLTRGSPEVSASLSHSIKLNSKISSIY